MRTPELSIIVPVYNAEAYLNQCITSLLAQEYDYFEIILVDDGSSDTSGEICDGYAKIDKRICVIHQKNRGVSAARNIGIMHARGKYLAFVDSDDFVSKQMFKHLVETLNNSNADLACCNVDYYHDGKRIAIGNKGILPEIMTGKEFITHIFDRPRTVTGRIYNKLFYRNKIISMFDEDISVCEDLLFLINNCNQYSKVLYIDEPYYHIRERSDSLSRSNDIPIEQGLSVKERIIFIMEGVDSEIRDLAESDYLDSCLLYGMEKLSIFKNYVKNNPLKILRNTKIAVVNKFWTRNLVF